jgi:hypothetical protein
MLNGVFHQVLTECSKESTLKTLDVNSIEKYIETCNEIGINTKSLHRGMVL